jgi:hypothetical protein
MTDVVGEKYDIHPFCNFFAFPEPDNWDKADGGSVSVQQHKFDVKFSFPPTSILISIPETT